jgi:hypothetical protein
VADQPVLALINQSEPDVGRLDPQQSYVVLGGGDRLVKDLHTILRFSYFMDVFLSHSPASHCQEAFLNQ